MGMGHRSEDFAELRQVVIGVFPYSISKLASGLFCQETQKFDVSAKVSYEDLATSTLWESCHRICMIATVDSKVE